PRPGTQKCWLMGWSGRARAASEDMGRGHDHAPMSLTAKPPPFGLCPPSARGCSIRQGTRHRGGAKLRLECELRPATSRRRRMPGPPMTNLTTTSHRLQGIDLKVRRKGRGPRILVLHGGGGPVLGHPFADRLAERFELIEPVHPGFAGTPIPDH